MKLLIQNTFTQLRAIYGGNALTLVTAFFGAGLDELLSKQNQSDLLRPL
jgi:hypothetical protein